MTLNSGKLESHQFEKKGGLWIREKQKGFSLVEMLIVIVFISILIGITSAYVSQSFDFLSNNQTETNIRVIGQAVEEAYEDNAWSVDLNHNANIDLGSLGVIANNSNTYADVWRNIALQYTSSQTSIEDGYNHAFRVFVSERQARSYKGILIPFHVIAIVSGQSPEPDNQGASVINTTFDPTTGAINIADRESVYVVSGYDIQKRIFDRSQEKLENLAGAYKDYYWSRFSTRGREPAINYFGKLSGDNRWDSDVPGNGTNVIAICNGGVTLLPGGRAALGQDITASGLAQELSLNSSAIQSGWGRNFRILNCGSSSNVQVNATAQEMSTRTPYTNDLPPYTAILGFSLPNSETYTETVTSNF